MKFTSTAVLGLSALATSSAFAPLPTVPTKTVLYSTTEAEGTKKRTKKEDRLQFMKNEQFHRRGFKEVRDKVENTITEQYESEVVGELKSNNFLIEREGVKVHLAKVCIRRLVLPFYYSMHGS